MMPDGIAYRINAEGKALEDVARPLTQVET